MAFTRQQAIDEMNALVNKAQQLLEEAAALGNRWDVPFEYNLNGSVDEPSWDQSDWQSSSAYC